MVILHFAQLTLGIKKSDLLKAKKKPAITDTSVGYDSVCRPNKI